MGSGPGKLPCGGGDGASHSSVFACHGFFPAILPANMLQKKLTMRISWPAPRMSAPYVMNVFIGWNAFRKSYCVGS